MITATTSSLATSYNFIDYLRVAMYDVMITSDPNYTFWDMSKCPLKEAFPVYM